jgi:hypothetical protein
MPSLSELAMQGMLPLGYEVSAPDDLENQLQFYGSILADSVERPFGGKRATGVFQDRIRSDLRVIDDLLQQEINPSFTPEYLMPQAYRPFEITSILKQLSPEKAVAFAALRQLRADAAADFAKRQVEPHLRSQWLAPGLLDNPPFFGQGDSNVRTISQQACLNACTRMFLAALIPDFQPSELALTRAYGNAIVKDEEYLKILESPECAAKSGCKIRIYSLMGIDFETIAEIARKAKEKQQGTRCYAVVSMLSETAGNLGVWHNVVLLAADQGTVTVHDPAARLPRANRVMDKADFAYRWSATYNRAHIIRASPR